VRHVSQYFLDKYLNSPVLQECISNASHIFTTSHISCSLN